MPKSVKPLSDTEIKKSAKPQDKEYSLSDGDGLLLLIKPDGTKQWIFRYTSPTQNKRRKTSFGTYPSVTLSDSRKKREEWQNLIKQGIDPIDDKREVKAEVKREKESNFANVVKLWLDDQERRLSGNTHKRKKALFENTVLKAFGERSIEEIDHTEIITIIENKALQTPETARRLFTYLNDLWQFACSRKYCKYNIIANIHRKSTLPTVKKVNYPKIVEPTILKELITTLYRYHGHYSTKNALKFVLHVPLRASNLVTLKWSFIDFEKQLLTIPRAEMKSKDKNVDDFKLPLTDEAIAILKEQYLYTSNKEYVFVTDNGAHLNQETPNRALERLGFNDELRGRRQRLHSFRGTFRSIVETNQMVHRCSYESREKVLDHAIGTQTERAYTNKADYTQEMRLLLNWWSGYVLAMMEG
jgi:integrase